jgi:hypothetical protein
MIRLHGHIVFDSQTTFVVGRDPYWQLPLEDDYISRIHAMIFWQDSRWYLMDLGSMNGTRHNYIRLPPLSPVALQAGDVIQFYTFWFMVQQVGLVTVNLPVDDGCQVYPALGVDHLDPAPDRSPQASGWDIMNNRWGVWDGGVYYRRPPGSAS